MNALEGIMANQNGATFGCIGEALKPFDEFNKKFAAYMARMNGVIGDYLRTREVPDLTGWENWEDIADGKVDERKNSTKENIDLQKVKTEPPASPPRGRRRRNASKEASQKIGNQSNMPTDGDVQIQKLNIKMEKLTMSTVAQSPATSHTVHSPLQQLPVANEEVEGMSAPSRPAPRRTRTRRKATDRKIKLEKLDEEEEQNGKTRVRDSDVIVQEAAVAVVHLDSSADDEKTLKAVGKKKSKRLRNSSSEDDGRTSAEKRPKSKHDDTHYEDARSSVGAAAATSVATPAPNMNATVVVDNPKYPTTLIPQSVIDVMTDDESEEDVQVKTAPKRAGRIPVAKKPVFSPFEQSPVKQKVQAFEKLREEAFAMPPRITRTTTRSQAKKEPSVEEDPTNVSDDETNAKEKTKIVTPLGTKFLPKAASTTLKTSRAAASPNSHEKSVVSAKSASALKASQAEFREREKKRRAKEEEALKKREALLRTQMEEKRRRMEEKQSKAQQQREMLQMEKRKALEAQRLKEERHKQLVAEQEKRKLREKEEQEKKRQRAKMRALEAEKRAEERRREEEKKTEEMALRLAERDKDIAQMAQKRKERKKNAPIYLQEATPPLPTPDCYDTDDEDRGDVGTLLPDWWHQSHLRHMHRCTAAAGERIKNTLFSIQAQTPDLRDIFEDIEPKKLQRNSSAVWHKPPRFTMMPVLEMHDETEEFDDDFQ